MQAGPPTLSFLLAKFITEYHVVQPFIFITIVCFLMAHSEASEKENQNMGTNSPILLRCLKRPITPVRKQNIIFRQAALRRCDETGRAGWLEAI